MSELRQAMGRYVALRQSLGFQFEKPAHALRDFVSFMEADRAVHITTDLALHWAKQPTGVQPAMWARRLGFVRCFAAWLSATDPRTEVPPKGILSARYRRNPPYIYSDAEIARLLKAAGELPSQNGLRALTYSTLFGLIAVTGMRSSEALAFDRADVDLLEGIFNIRQTKFRKSRLVPVHTSTLAALRRYAESRDCTFPRLATPAFFVSQRGVRITKWSAGRTFAKVSRQIGLRAPTEGDRHGHGPRLHDMRHRFATKTLVGWYRAGLDVERELPKLATYLGHAHVNDTYWYLEAVPELLQLATARLMDKRKEVQP